MLQYSTRLYEPNWVGCQEQEVGEKVCTWKKGFDIIVSKGLFKMEIQISEMLFVDYLASTICWEKGHKKLKNHLKQWWENFSVEKEWWRNL